MVGNPGTVSTENIDEVILRLLKIKSGTEIDYQTYFNAIKKRLAAHRMVGAEIPAEEDQLLREELKRVGKLKDKGRFKVKTKKAKISTEQTNTPEESSKTGAIIKAPPGGKITPDKLRPPQVEPVNVKDITEKTAAISKGSSPLGSINKKLDSIISTLLNVDKESKKEKEKQRRESESKKRSEKEKGLESKRFDGIKKALSSITKPFQSIWDRIVNFITNIILGRIILKLIDWFADPDNKDKIQSLIRFVKDWWPALLGSYILFGTSFGRLVRGLTGMVGRFIFQIGKVAIPKLLRFIRSPLGAGALLFTAGATVPAMFPGTVNEQERKTEKAPGTNAEKITALEKQKANLNPFEKLQGKGSEIDEQIEFLKTGKTKSYGFSGGGFANFGKMFGGAAMGAGLGSMFGPMGTLLGAGVGAVSGTALSSGLISGPKGRDKVPAMLTDGEFVMSTGAVQKYGVETLEAMNAAGGGTNQPKIVNGKTYAAGGGLIGSERYSISPGFRGESSRSDVYLIRAVNELIKVLRNKFPDNRHQDGFYPSGSSGLPGGSALSQQLANIAEQISSSGSQLYQGVSATANRGAAAASSLANRGAAAASAAANRAMPIVNRGAAAASSLANRGAAAASAAANRAMPIVNRGAAAASSLANRGMGFARRSAEVAVEKAKPLIEKAKVLPAMMDYGSLYLRSQFGGLGGSITEADLSRQTQDEYRKAFERARLRVPTNIRNSQSVVNQYERLLRAPNLTPEQKRDYNNKLANARGELAKYKRGLINVEYDDFLDEKGKLSGAAEAAQKTLGAVWASQEKDGGIKIEREPYDFPIIKDPIGLMLWKSLSEKEKLAWLDKQNPSSAIVKKLDPRKGGSFSKWGNQDIAEAMYSLNPFATPVDTDVKIGGRPRAKGILDTFTNIVDNPLMSMTRGLALNLLKGKERNILTGEAEKGSLWDRMFPQKTSNQKALEAKRPWWDKMGLFGGASRVQQEKVRQSMMSGYAGRYVSPSQQQQFSASGISQERNRKRLEAKRPWWDKMGWFGGSSAQIRQQQASRRQGAARAAAVGQYGRYSPGRSQAKFTAPPRRTTSVKPPSKPRTTTARPPTYRGGQRGSGSRPTSPSNPPKFSPTHRRGTTTTQATLGVRK